MPAVLPDLALVVAAAFLLLIAAALWVLERLITGSLGHAPVIGGWISREVGGWLNDARNAILRAAHSTWDGVINVLDWLSDFEYRMFEGVVNTFIHVSATVVHIVDVRLPQLWSAAVAEVTRSAGQVRAYADALVTAAEHWAAREITAVRDYADSLAAAAEQLAAREVTAARDYAAELVTGAEQLAAADLAKTTAALTAGIAAAGQLAATEVGQLATSVQASVDVLARDITAGVATAEAVAAARLAAVRSGIYTDLETIGDQAVALGWPDPAADLAGLRRAIGGDFPWLQDLLGALGGAGAAGLAGALIRSMAGTHAITRLAEDCIVPNCRNLSGLGNALHQLLAAGFDAALLGWVAYCITDPVAAAANTNTVAGPVAADTIGALEHLLGVKGV